MLNLKLFLIIINKRTLNIHVYVYNMYIHVCIAMYVRMYRHGYIITNCILCTYVLIVPIPVVQITVFGYETLQNDTLGNLTIGDPLTLDCTVTAVRGISSSVDIIWTTGGRIVRRVYNITADIEDDNAVYTDSFEISSLSAIDNGREYQCTVVINANQPVNGSDQIILIFPSEYV